MVLRSQKKIAQLVVEHLPPSSLILNPKNARRHSRKQLTKLGSVISAYGFNVPIVIDEGGVVLAGNGRLEVALLQKLSTVPCVRLTHLTEAQKTAFAIADNKLGDMSDFDDDKLRELLQELVNVEYDMELTAFDTGEIDMLLDPVVISTSSADSADSFDEPDPTQPAVTRLGDLWQLGPHRLLCGNALEEKSYRTLLMGSVAAAVVTDPPYNVPIAGHVSGLGRNRHREFPMGAGEMSKEDFETFLRTSLGNMAQVSADGSLHYVFMDWRHLHLLLGVGATLYTELKNICVWAKSNGGMGSLYRSQHEMVPVFKKGTAAHQNNVQLGKFGRWRTNVWEYAGANAFSATRAQDLEAHPTPKPIALIADAIRDCTRRGDIVLDGFAGAGTIILAAERTGRRAAALELDPLYVDTAVRRWQALTGQSATLAGDGGTFHQVQTDRAAPSTDVEA